jgi:hypothetical protein
MDCRVKPGNDSGETVSESTYKFTVTLLHHSHDSLTSLIHSHDARASSPS